MRVAIILPTLDEESTIASALDALRLFPAEVIVVDGGSRDRTVGLVAERGVRMISSQPGRARQMNAGAGAARGDVLLFLHADTRLPPSAIADIRSALDDPRCAGGRFDLRLDSHRWIFSLVGFLISLRSRLSRVATGDQAIFVRRKVFEEIGGFPDIPIMEDTAFSRALKEKGRIACLRSQVVTSARRWEKEGVCRTILKMWILKILYFAGVSPFRLKRFYADLR
jgi:rSAM/selenodomain-associated transferase 2